MRKSLKKIFLKYIVKVYDKVMETKKCQETVLDEGSQDNQMHCGILAKSLQQDN